MDKLVNDVEEIKKTLVAIQKTLSEAKGGWRMLLLIGGAAGTLGAGITQVIHWLGSK
jgi:hypothetical protein